MRLTQLLQKKLPNSQMPIMLVVPVRMLRTMAPTVMAPVAMPHISPKVSVPVVPVILPVRFSSMSMSPLLVSMGDVMLVGNAFMAPMNPMLIPMNIMKTHAPMQRLLNVFILRTTPSHHGHV